MRQLSLATIFLGLSFLPVNSQDETGPAKALLVADHIRGMAFSAVGEGVKGLRTTAANGVEIIALRIDATRHKFALQRQSSGEGLRVEDAGENGGILIAFNGGFFGINDKGVKYPVGLFAQNNIRQSTPWHKTGGYLVINKGAVSIVPTLNNPVPVGEEVVQSKPHLIEPGGKWAMNTNGLIPKKRTIICQDRSGDIVVVAVIGGGLSLYEAGWLMRGHDVGGYFDCDTALAMDGGGSTQIWVKDRPDLSFSGETPVHNVIVIEPQPQE